MTLSSLIVSAGRKARQSIARTAGMLRCPFFGLPALCLILVCLLGISSLELKRRGSLFSEQWSGGPFVSQKDISYLESPDLCIIEGSAVRAVPVPAALTARALGALIGSDVESEAHKEIVEYIVESGDTVWSIAERFNISSEAILWANDLNKNSLLKLGKTLVIPPVSGIIHHVAQGDTIGSIAEKYKAKSGEIISFNDISSQGEIFISDILVVPGGVMPKQVAITATEYIPLAQSYFICPVSAPCKITQGLHWYNAIDFSHGECGEPIYAAAEGTVLKVMITDSRSMWVFGGAGNHLTILHPNGVVTFYGHLQTSLVSPGQRVSQGQIIALMGGRPGASGAGNSTGCHLHFGVNGARNPFAK